ncbi:MAG: hypothetical protein JNM42_02425, partial [Propionivibrio sp.]|nr:hypothetical protein [Propionivibrio sp.]
VKPFRPPNSTLDDHESLRGVGWGMNATLGKHVFARLTFGYGLDEVPLQPRNYAINFQVIGSAF